MLKFGFRNKQFYPLMLLLFIFLRKCLEIILKFHPYSKYCDFITAFLIFFSQSLIGYIIHIHYSQKSVKEGRDDASDSSSVRLGKIKLFFNKEYKSSDSKYKKYLLILFTSFFNFVGAVIRSDDVINFGNKEENNSQLEIRVRGIQIIISALLCYFTIRLTVYKHQKVSLVIIAIFLALLIAMELFITMNIVNKILSLLICTMSCLSRSFLDITEKYLFDYDYVNILMMLIYEGLIGVFFYILFFIFNDSYQTQGKHILEEMSTFDLPFVTFILFIIVYIIISGLRNSYRVTTNKYYSPMSRALFESTLDPFLFLYNTLTSNYKKNLGFWLYFGSVFFSLAVIAFFSLVYNDFIILFCCGLEQNTYNGITYRLYTKEVIEVEGSEKDWDKISTNSYHLEQNEQNENVESIELAEV